MLARTSLIPDISIKASTRRTKLVGNPNWRKNGLWSGKDVTTLYDPKPVKYRPLIRTAQREALIALVSKFLAQWQSSPWQNEGPARRQLRNHFVAMDHGWAAADLEAAKIIETALRKLGHPHRPSWEDGQPEATRVDGQCLQCGRDLRPVAGRSTSAFFCYPKPGRTSCENAYNRHRDVAFKASQTTAAQRVYREAFINAQPAKPCEHCGNKFKAYGQRFCSHECATAAATEIPERACLCCGAMFRPVDRQRPGRYCSTACSAKGRTTSSMIPCQECGTPFKVHKSKPKRFCAVACYRANEAAAKAARAIRCDPA